MRTTINVNDQLLLKAKAQAAASGVTLGQLVEGALRESLARQEKVANGGRARLITMRGTGPQPGHRSR